MYLWMQQFQALPEAATRVDPVLGAVIGVLLAVIGALVTALVYLYRAKEQTAARKDAEMEALRTAKNRQLESLQAAKDAEVKRLIEWMQAEQKEQLDVLRGVPVLLDKVYTEMTRRQAP